MKWTPFKRSYYPPVTADELRWKFGVSVMEAEQILEEMRTAEVYLNNKYQVQVRDHQLDKNWPRMVHLSIKRIDKEPVHDWRDLQRIKNELVGEECEGIELYPAESRVVDGANQYHLWVVKDPSKRIPVGFFDGRMVSGAEKAESIGAKQRPFEE